MMLLAVLLQATAAPPLPPIGRQALPKTGCAAYLWSAAGDRQLVAMATATPGAMRLALDGRAVDYARVGEGGTVLGFAASQSYRGGDLTATLDIVIESRDDLSKGAQVPTGTLTIARTGRDTIVLPVAGLIGCA